MAFWLILGISEAVLLVCSAVGSALDSWLILKTTNIYTNRINKTTPKAVCLPNFLYNLGTNVLKLGSFKSLFFGAAAAAWLDAGGVVGLAGLLSLSTEFMAL